MYLTDKAKALSTALSNFFPEITSKGRIHRIHRVSNQRIHTPAPGRSRHSRYYYARTLAHSLTHYATPYRQLLTH